MDGDGEKEVVSVQSISYLDLHAFVIQRKDSWVPKSAAETESHQASVLKGHRGFVIVESCDGIAP